MKVDVDENHTQIPFTMTLELLNGDSHFSEEEASLLQTIIYLFIFVALAALGNLLLFMNDNIVYDRQDNPLFATMAAFSMLTMKSISQFFYMVQYAYWGQGYIIFRIQSTISGLMGQSFLCILFLSLAYGYGTL